MAKGEGGGGGVGGFNAKQTRSEQRGRLLSGCKIWVPDPAWGVSSRRGPRLGLQLQVARVLLTVGGNKKQRPYCSPLGD